MISGLQVGWDKSVAFPIGPPILYNYLQSSDLQISPKFKYLGINIGTDFLEYGSLNISPVVFSMETIFHVWASLPLNLIG